LSEIRATTISDAAGTGPITLTGQSAAKAWVNFNATGTAAIRESFNISSLTDNGTGDIRSNFTSNMANADFSISSATDQNSTTSYNFQGIEVFGGQNVAYCGGLYRPNTGSDVKADVSRVRRTIHGDLA